MKGNIRQGYLLGSVLFLAVFLAGCSSQKQAFRHPEADLSAITRVAVMPFENLTTTQYAGEKVWGIYISQLLMSIDVDVVEPGEVVRVLRSHEISSPLLGQEEIKLVGSELQADTIIFGSVQEYGQARFRTDSFPVISVNVRWVDVSTGTIIFMGTESAKGNPKVPVIDVGEEQLFSVLTVDVCQKLIDMVR